MKKHHLLVMLSRLNMSLSLLRSVGAVTAHRDPVTVNCYAVTQSTFFEWKDGSFHNHYFTKKKSRI